MEKDGGADAEVAVGGVGVAGRIGGALVEGCYLGGGEVGCWHRV